MSSARLQQLQTEADSLNERLKEFEKQLETASPTERSSIQAAIDALNLKIVEVGRNIKRNGG